MDFFFQLTVYMDMVQSKIREYINLFHLINEFGSKAKIRELNL